MTHDRFLEGGVLLWRGLRLVDVFMCVGLTDWGFTLMFSFLSGPYVKELGGCYSLTFNDLQHIFLAALFDYS